MSVCLSVQTLQHREIDWGPVLTLQLTLHPLRPETIKEVNEMQMQGKTPTKEDIRDPDIVNVISKYEIVDELFPIKQGKS